MRYTQGREKKRNIGIKVKVTFSSRDLGKEPESQDKLSKKREKTFKWKTK